MVTIITGEKDTGKTSYLAEWYRRELRGVGFLSRKVFEEGHFLGYDLVMLPGMRAIPFIRLAGSESEKSLSEDVIRQGRFSFDNTAFQYASCWVNSYPLQEDDPVWMDEIGALELSGRGFDELLRVALMNDWELRLVFRERIFTPLLNSYSISKYIELHIPSSR